MRYELYVDSLFLMNFGMNLYLLMLVNRSTLYTSGVRRLIFGAATGSIGFLLLFLLPFPGVLRGMIGIGAGTAGMLFAAFPVKSLRMFLKLLEKLFIYSFCMGGLQFFLLRLLPGLERWLTDVWGALTVGVVAFLLLKSVLQSREEKRYLCKAILSREGASMTVMALIDSGNSLTEPISGKPVCVVEEKVFRGLWNNSMQGFRVIPYHSVGKSRGIMNGYLLPQLWLETDGVRREFKDVYIAVSEEGIHPAGDGENEAVKMIINPMLLAGRKKERSQRRQNGRAYGSESCNTGENAV